MLGKVFAGGDTQFCRHQLDDHRHHVGPHDHPQQGIAVGGSGLDISGKVSGIDVANGRDKGGPHQGKLDFTITANVLLRSAASEHSVYP
ncbi:hypothetical protein D3C71_1977900 [compost metagenome]